MAIKATAVVPTAAKPKHLDGIGDFQIYQAIRLLGDQLQNVADRLTAAESTITTLITTVNSLETQLTATRRDTDQALSPTQVAP